MNYTPKYAPTFWKTQNLITYSWTKYTEVSHKISGHLFEVIDYYLDNEKKEPDLLILIPEVDTDLIERIIKCLKDKYKKEYQYFLDDILFGRPKFLQTEIITFTDGVPPETLFNTGHLILWLCARETWWVKSDKRNYQNNKSRLLQNTFKKLTIKYHRDIHNDAIEEIIDRMIPFNAESLFTKEPKIKYYKNVSFQKEKGTLLIYATQNCRSLDTTEEYVEDIIISIKRIKPTKILYLGAKEPKHLDTSKLMEELLRLEKEFNIPVQSIPENEMPLMNFHNKFGSYLYTPTAKNWDCSPRLLKESLIYKKNVYFTKGVLDTIKDNKGLYHVFKQYFPRK